MDNPLVSFEVYVFLKPFFIYKRVVIIEEGDKKKIKNEVKKIFFFISNLLTSCTEDPKAMRHSVSNVRALESTNLSVITCSTYK